MSHTTAEVAVFGMRPSPSLPHENPAWRAAGVVFLLALVLRLIWAAEAHVTPLSDFGYYQGVSHVLVETGIYGYPGRRAWVPPGYPLFIAAIYEVFGESHRTVGIIQAMLGALSAGLATLLCARVFSRACAWTAGLMYAVSPVAIAYIPAYASENLAIPLMLGALLLAGVARQREGRNGLVWAAVCGLAVGLLMLVRSVGLFILPAILLLLLYRRRERSWNLRQPAAFLIVVVIVLSAWTIRNYRIGLGFMPFTSSGGAGIYIANTDSGLNGEWGEPSYDCVNIDMTEAERAKAYSEAANKWIRSHLGRYMALCRTRMARLLGAEPDLWAARMLSPTKANDLAMSIFFNAAEQGMASTPEVTARARAIEAQNTSYLYWMNVLILCPAGLIAMFLAVLQWRRTGVIVLPLILYLGGLSLTVASMRYRLLSDPLLFMLIAALWCDVFGGQENLGRRPGRGFKIALLVLACHGSVFGHVSGMFARFYALAPMPAPAPPDLTFSPANLQSVEPSWVYRTQATIEPGPTGVSCNLKGTEDVSSAQYGGISFAITACEAVRLELGWQHSIQIQRVFVDFTDAEGNRVARWQWDALGSILDGQPQSYVFVPGRPVERFAVIEHVPQGTPARAHVFLEIAPQSEAGFIIHAAECGVTASTSEP